MISKMTVALLTLAWALSAHAGYVNLNVNNLSCSKAAMTLEYKNKNSLGQNVFLIRNFANLSTNTATVTETLQTALHIVMTMSSELSGELIFEIDSGYKFSALTWAPPYSMQSMLEWDCRGEIENFK